MTPLEVLSVLSKRNSPDIKMAPLANITSAVSGKDGIGTISIAVPNEVVKELLVNSSSFVGGLILCDRTAYESCKSEHTPSETFTRTIDDLRRISIPVDFCRSMFGCSFPEGEKVDLVMEGDVIHIREHDRSDESKSTSRPIKEAQEF